MEQNRKEQTNMEQVKFYHVWTTSKNWDFVVTETELKQLKTSYYNFKYELIQENKGENGSMHCMLEKISK